MNLVSPMRRHTPRGAWVMISLRLERSEITMEPLF